MHAFVDWRPPQATTNFVAFIFFALKSDGRKDSMASSPIVIALRAASPIYTLLPMRPVFGWLLRHPKQQEPSKSMSPPPSLFFLFLRSICHPKRWANVLPHAFRPFESPLQSPPPPTPSFRWLSRFIFNWRPPKTGAPPITQFVDGRHFGALTRVPNAARASPGAGRLY